MRALSVLILVLAGLCAGCASGPSTAPSIATAGPPTAPAITTVPSVVSPSSGATPEATLAADACALAGPQDQWTEVPDEAGRCHVRVFDPPMSFGASPGWLWAGSVDRWAMTRDNGYFTFLSVYRYGGAVVPAYCKDPPPTIQMATGSEIVSWLKTVADLKVDVVGRSVGPNPAWQLDLASNVPSCSGDKGKSGLAALWTIAGQPIELPESLGQGDRMRAYIVELSSGIVIITAITRPLEGTPGVPDNADFLVRVEEIFSSLAFD